MRFLQIKKFNSYSLVAAIITLNGCLTISGDYKVSAYDSNGPVIEEGRLIAHGSGIYTARNGICLSHPNATVIIKDIHTGEELKSESPYQCH